MLKFKSVLLLTLMALPLAVAAQSAEEKGLEIARAADAYDQGFTDFMRSLVLEQNACDATHKRLSEYSITRRPSLREAPA